MMKKYIISAIIILFSYALRAQDNTVTIKLNETEDLLDIIDLGDNGLLFKTGLLVNIDNTNYTYTKKLNWKAYHYSSTLDKLWELPIQNYSTGKYGDYFVSSPDASKLYQLEIKGMINGKSLLTLINNGVLSESKEIDDVKKNGFRLISVFCDTNYIYFLNTKKGTGIDKKEKFEEKIVFTRFSKESFSRKQIVLDLPEIEKDYNFWWYAGPSNNGFYLYNKNLNKNTFKYSVLSLDSAGKVYKKYMISDSLDGGCEFEFSDTYKYYPGSKVEDNSVDFYSSPRSEWYLNGKGYFKFDEKNNVYYIYGIYSVKVGKKDNYGFYICKYDMTGKRIWKLQKELNNEVVDKKIAYHSKSLFFNLNPDNSIDLNIGWADKVFAYNIVSDGKLKDEGKLITFDHIVEFENLVKTNMTYTLLSNPKSANYAYLFKQKAYAYKLVGCYYSSKGFIIAEKDQGDEIKLLYFKY
jgi:hypothetical protein